MLNNVIKKASNKWTKGLIMDFSPENTSNEVLTHALNATLLTFNGNEMSLQNDMGNGRVETAFLPEGYIPVGTCEYGGIIYIVSYNPLEDKSQIGCFPSPERNISNEELGESDRTISSKDFQEGEEKEEKFIPNGTLKSMTYNVQLRNDNLNPGDKFIISSTDSIYDEHLLDLTYKNNDNELIQTEHPIIALNIVSIEENGKINYLNNDLRQYEHPKSNKTYSYHIVGETSNTEGNIQKIDIDSYRNILSSGYNVFKSKTSGKLAILAELISIDSYSVTHAVEPTDYSNVYDIVIYTDISPTINSENYLTFPKLKYYYLSESNCQILRYKNNEFQTVTLFNEDNSVNSEFGNTTLSEIYEVGSNPPEEAKIPLSVCGKFDFYKKNTYHGRLNDYKNNLEWDEKGNLNIPENIKLVYTKFYKNKLHKLTREQIRTYQNYFLSLYNVNFYYYKESGGYSIVENKSEINVNDVYYVPVYKNKYQNAQRDIQYKNKVLYKFESDYKPAPVEYLKNANILKFWKQTSTIYRQATEAELNDPENLEGEVGIMNDGEWVESANINLPGVTYYLKIEKEVMTSYGFVAIDPDDENIIVDEFYYATDPDYITASPEEIELYYDYIKHPYDNKDPLYGHEFILYYETEYKDSVYVEATLEQKTDFFTTIYKNDYYQIKSLSEIIQNTIITDNGKDVTEFFIRTQDNIFASSLQFLPNKNNNWITFGNITEDEELRKQERPNSDPISLHIICDFIPDESNDYNYEGIKLASIQIPQLLIDNKTNFNCKYDYKLVPCMNYGRLDHLATSGTVDFNNLFNFEKSKFNVWKYRIDGKQLRLTFGAEIYDTFENYKVDALVLEFYDLYGFVGSLEITGKKSYSGVFTKLIQLDSLEGLNKKKITNNKYIDNFVHSVNIQNNSKFGEIGTEFKYNGESVTYNSETGWKLESGNKIENDCGIIFSSMIYGVKAYWRQTTENNEYKFTKNNDDFFLFTFPIYNDYYYKYDNYHEQLTNPELDLILTYKLINTGSVNSLNLTDEKVPNSDIVNGYNITDKENIETYVSGIYPEQTLKVTKYYKYTGTSKLYLEIGLPEYYKDINIGYEPMINNHFSCTLQLVGNESEKEFDITSSVVANNTEKQLLNYDKHKIITENNTEEDYSDMFENKLNFKIDEENTATKYDISSKKFNTYNFSNNPRTDYISIDYEFICGYYANIVNIQESYIPVTTVCALCHKNIEDRYNYEDFGVYEQDNVFLSKIMYYNGGTGDEEVFGLCQQTTNLLENSNGTKSNVLDQCSPIGSPVTNIANDLKTPGKLNTQALNQITQFLGKLNFCTPHAHSDFNEKHGNNIHLNEEKNDLNISKNITNMVWNSDNDGEFKDWNGTGSEDTTRGIAASKEYYENPKYNLVLNTQKSLEQNSEFISTINYDFTEGRQRGFDLHGDHYTDVWTDWVGSSDKDRNFVETLNNANDVWFWNRRFTGFNAEQLSKFNKKLIQTMKGIYVYNPDYDSLTVNIGNALIEDKLVQINSNIVSTNAKLSEDIVFNNFVGIKSDIRSDYMSHYLQYLQNHSSINTKDDSNKFLPQVNFQPGLKYCGKDNEYALITSLTYNVPVPQDFENELTFKSDNKIVIKHEDGINTFLSGKINKKALYAFVNNKLIQLDVSNYKIKDDGQLYIRYLTNYYKSGRINTPENSKSRAMSSTSNLATSNLISNNQSFVYNGNTYVPNVSGDVIILDPSINIDDVELLPVLEYTSVNSTSQTKNYSDIIDSQYKVYDKYKDARIRGTSIVINDLQYNPDSEHRLFIKNLGNKCMYDSLNELRNIIYYRALPNVTKSEDIDKDIESQNILKTWTAVDDSYQHKNHLYLFTGPCFTINNL